MLICAIPNSRPLSTTPDTEPVRRASTGSSVPRKITSSNKGASTTAVNASRDKASGSRLSSTSSNNGLLPPGSPKSRTSNQPVSTTRGVTLNQPARAVKRAPGNGRHRHCSQPPSGVMSLGRLAS